MAELKLHKQLGRRLSHDELDGNFTALELELEKKANTADLQTAAQVTAAIEAALDSASTDGGTF